MTESKWCNCKEPKFGPVNDGWRKCFGCGLERKWKDILGTELINYPIGTVFRLPQWTGRKHLNEFKLIRESGELMAYVFMPSGWTMVRDGMLASLMLQDRFEIVDESK